MSSSSLEDAAIVRRFQAAAAAAEREAVFETIFRIHRGRIYALCVRLCANRALAEDALQETFLEVFKGLPHFRGDSQLSTWMYPIAVRSALRVRARHSVRAEADVESMTEASEPQTIPSDRDNARALQAALDTLPAEQRVVVALFAVDGLTHGEIAAILGIPEGTVWSRLHVARKRLHAALR